MSKMNLARKLNSVMLMTVAALVSTSSLDAQTTPGPMPSICNRACWGARAPACQPGNITALTRAIVHHTAGTGDWTTDYEGGKARLRGVQNYHIDVVGFCDVSYHFVMNAGGHIYEGRNGAMSGLPKGYHDCCNVNSFAFNVMGYYHPPYNQPFTQASLDSLNATIAWRMPSGWSPYGAGNYCGATVGTLDGHRRVSICNNGTAGGSACPGDGIYNAFVTDDRNGGPIRNGVAARRTSAINPPYYFGGSTEGWTAGNSLTAPWWTGSGWPGVLVTDQTGADAYMHSATTSFVGGSDMTVNVNVYPQNGTTAGHDMQLHWKSTAENFWDAAKSSPMVGFTAQNGWTRLNLDVHNAKWIGQTLNQLRLDFDQNNQGVRWIVNHIIPQTTPRWWFNNDSQGWTIGNGLSGLTWTACCGWTGVMYADQTAPDAFFYSPNFNYLGGCNDKLYLKFFVQNGNTANHEIKVYWLTASDGVWNEAKSSETVQFTAQNSWADLAIRVGANVNWYSDFITKLRFDVDGNSSNSGARWIIDYIVIMPDTQQQTIAPTKTPREVDNSSAGFSVVGTWSTGSSAADKFGADYRYHSTQAVSEPAQWTTALNVGGAWTVKAWWPQGANRSATAPYVVDHDGGSTTVNVNQQTGGGAWQTLGTWNMSGTKAVKLSCWTTTGYIVVADAVRWE